MHHSDDRMTNGKCLMGHKVSYVRRKQFSQCFNPEVHISPSLTCHLLVLTLPQLAFQEFERPTSYENCPCQASDFEW